MTTISSLQISQPLTSQPITTEQPQQPVSFKGDYDCYAKSSKADVAAVTVVGVAFGALATRPLMNMFDHLKITFNSFKLPKDVRKQTTKQSHEALSQFVKTEKAAVKEMKAYINELKKEAKEAAKDLKADKHDPFLQSVAKEAKENVKAEKAALKEITKLPLKYRAVAAAASAAVVGCTYAIAKALTGDKCSE